MLYVRSLTRLNEFTDVIPLDSGEIQSMDCRYIDKINGKFKLEIVFCLISQEKGIRTVLIVYCSLL